MTHANNRIEVTQTFRATPEEVWQRWTTEEGLSTWWWTQFPDTTYAIDCRPGGHWHIATAAVGIGVGGTYEEIEAPRHLAFTWIWSDESGEGPVEHVDVTFAPDAEGTRLVIVHTGPWDAGQADDYRQGWHDVLAELGNIVSA